MARDYSKIFKEGPVQEPVVEEMESVPEVHEAMESPLEERPIEVKTEELELVPATYPVNQIASEEVSNTGFVVSLVKGMSINLKKEKDLKSETIQKINENEVLILEENDSIWALVVTPYGNKGYILSKFISF